MLRPRALAQVLSQAIGREVHNSLLLNQEGSLLAFSGQGDKAKDARVMAAIAANLWTTCERGGAGATAAFQEERLTSLLVDCEQGRLYICLVSDLLLCLCGTAKVNPGLLQRKGERLAEYLREPLGKIAAS